MPAARRRAVLGAFLLLTVGCRDGGDDPPAASTTTATVSAGAPGDVTLGIAGALVVDPLDASPASSSDLMVLDLLHDGLTRIDADGAAQPALATEWETNDELTAFRFHLDPATTFTDGRAIRAHDVIASLERVMAAGDSSLAARSLEAVVGFEAFVAGDAERVEGLTSPDDATVRVALQSPLSALPEVLASPLLGVVDAGLVAGGDLGDLALSGAWAAEEAAGDGLRLVPRSGGRTTLTAVDLRPFTDADAAYDAFDEGEVDWAAVPPDRLDDAVAAYGDDAFAPFQAEVFFGLNQATLGNAALREAIVAAIDREAIAEAVYADRADPLTTVVPVGVLGHDPGTCDDCGFDADRATAAIAAAYPAGDVPVVPIDFDTSSEAQAAMAEMVADDLEAAGIPTELRPRPLDRYEEFIATGQQALFSFGWIGAYRSPDAYLAPLFSSASPDNLGAFRSEAVDGLLTRARSGADTEENSERWAAAERRILGAAAIVPIAQFRTQVVVADRVEGLVHAVDGTVDWTEVSVADGS